MTTTTQRHPPRSRAGTGAARRGRPTPHEAGPGVGLGPPGETVPPGEREAPVRGRTVDLPRREHRARAVGPARLAPRPAPPGGATRPRRVRPERVRPERVRTDSHGRNAQAPRHGAPRTPFVFLVVGLLSGGLISLLLLNTVLAAGTFQITSLQQSNANLARQQQALQQEIADAQSPGSLARRARQLGMVPVSQPVFVNLKSGRIVGRPASSRGGAGH